MEDNRARELKQLSILSERSRYTADIIGRVFWSTKAIFLAVAFATRNKRKVLSTIFIVLFGLLNIVDISVAVMNAADWEHTSGKIFNRFRKERLEELEDEEDE